MWRYFVFTRVPQCSSAWEVKIPQPRDQKLDTQEANAEVAWGIKVCRNNVLLPLSAKSVASSDSTQPMITRCIKIHSPPDRVAGAVKTLTLHSTESSRQILNATYYLY